MKYRWRPYSHRPVNCTPSSTMVLLTLRMSFTQPSPRLKWPELKAWFSIASLVNCFTIRLGHIASGTKWELEDEKLKTKQRPQFRQHHQRLFWRNLTDANFTSLAPIVRRLDNAIYRINRYPVDKSQQNKPRYPLDSIIHPQFDRPGPGACFSKAPEKPFIF